MKRPRALAAVPEPSTRPRSPHLGRIPVVGLSALNRIAAAAHPAGGAT